MLPGSSSNSLRRGVLLVVVVLVLVLVVLVVLLVMVVVGNLSTCHYMYLSPSTMRVLMDQSIYLVIYLSIYKCSGHGSSMVTPICLSIDQLVNLFIYLSIAQFLVTMVV